MLQSKSKKIVVFGEIYSKNLGDGIIYECISALFTKYGVTTQPVDLSGRSDWDNSVDFNLKKSKVGLARRIVRIPVRSSQKIRKFLNVIDWYGYRRTMVLEKWESVIASCDAVVIGGGQLIVDRAC